MEFSCFLMLVTIARKRFILAVLSPNPQARRKERSHEALGKCKKKAENREPTTLCHESEDVYTSDFNTM